jgi:hypothetical protein
MHGMGICSYFVGHDIQSCIQNSGVNCKSAILVAPLACKRRSRFLWMRTLLIGGALVIHAGGLNMIDPILHSVYVLIADHSPPSAFITSSYTRYTFSSPEPPDSRESVWVCSFISKRQIWKLRNSMAPITKLYVPTTKSHHRASFPLLLACKQASVLAPAPLLKRKLTFQPS